MYLYLSYNCGYYLLIEIRTFIFQSQYNVFTYNYHLIITHTSVMTTYLGVGHASPNPRRTVLV